MWVHFVHSLLFVGAKLFCNKGMVNPEPGSTQFGIGGEQGVSIGGVGRVEAKVPIPTFS